MAYTIKHKELHLPPLDEVVDGLNFNFILIDVAYLSLRAEMKKHMVTI